MVNWLRHLTFLLLMVAARGRDEECDYARYSKFCWSSQTQNFKKNCWFCRVLNTKISKTANLTISGDRGNVSHADFEYVRFVGGSITKMPLVLLKKTNAEILQVTLFSTKTKVLDTQFFEHSSKSLKYFGCSKNNDLSVGYDAFRNWTSLEVLILSDNKLKDISPTAALGLSKLNRLDLETNSLGKLLPEWFFDLLSLEQLNLSDNLLANVPNDIFSTLTMLRILHLEENQIKAIRRRMFHHNKQLESLFLGDNIIKKIHVDSFNDLTKLTRLDVSNNNCVCVDFEVIDEIEEIHEDLAPCYPPTCIIPEIPNGHVVSTKDNSIQTPGDSLETLHSAKVVCNPNYFLYNETQTEVKCLVDDWQNQEWPECHSECYLRCFQFK